MTRTECSRLRLTVVSPYPQLRVFDQSATILPAAIEVLLDPLGGEFQLLVRPPRASPLQLFSGPGARKGNADCPQDGTDSTTRTVEPFSSSLYWHKNASIQQLSCLLAPDVRLVFQLLLCLVVAVPHRWHGLSGISWLRHGQRPVGIVGRTHMREHSRVTACHALRRSLVAQ
jgi:hypothetical protein